MKPHPRMVILSCLVMCGVWVAVALAQDLMVDFGLKADELKNNLVDALAKGHVPAYPDKNRFKSASPSLQTALVRNTLNWFKTYTESEAFKTDYMEKRDAAKPSAPVSASVDEKIAGYLDEQRRSLEEMKQTIAQMPPEMQEQMQAVVKQMEAEFETTAKDPQMAAMLKEAYEQENVSAQQAYKEQLAAWERQYPEDPRVMVAARLRQFMDVSGSVAFDAELVSDPNGSIMKFADAGYESQTKEWKLCYRAGQEAIQAARAVVGEWLRQMEGH